MSGARSQRPGVTEPASRGAPRIATWPSLPIKSAMDFQLMAFALNRAKVKKRAMWDRLLTDCHVATMDPAVPGPFGAIEDGAIGIQDGRIVRVGRRVELAGYRAKSVEPLGGAWVTPGLIDCHTHLVFGGDRAGEFEQRLNGASYEEIARAGGGIASTVRATRAASEEDLLAQSRPRLRALRAEGVTTLEIKSGYGLALEHERKCLHVARALGAQEGMSIRTTFL